METFFKAMFWMKNLHKPAKQVKPWHVGKNLTECLKRQPCISGYKTGRQKRISNSALGQGSQSAILAVHWTGTSHFTHHHSQFAAATRHSQSMSTTHKMKYSSVVFLWKMRDMGLWFPSPYVTVGRTGKRRSCVFWFGTDQPYKKHILNPTVSQDRNG